MWNPFLMKYFSAYAFLLRGRWLVSRKTYSNLYENITESRFRKSHLHSR